MIVNFWNKKVTLFCWSPHLSIYKALIRFQWKMDIRLKKQFLKCEKSRNNKLFFVKLLIQILLLKRLIFVYTKVRVKWFKAHKGKVFRSIYSKTNRNDEFSAAFANKNLYNYLLLPAFWNLNELFNMIEKLE